MSIPTECQLRAVSDIELNNVNVHFGLIADKAVAIGFEIIVRVNGRCQGNL